ncbi:hypothetical protein T484DRAFT_1885084 [Baffinella frigidus]|nr:hypothetical protein T484DRAFT_1885084 [Cryptophyta sp. CCMP2293]
MADRSDACGEPHQQEVARRRTGVAALAVVCCGAVLVVVGLGDSMGRARGEVGRSSLEQLLQGPSSARGALGLRLAARLGTAPREQELLGGSSKKNAFSQLKEAMDGAAKATVAQPKCQTPECVARRKAIQTRMDALKNQINHDFDSMINFGHKAGFLPPPQSIRKEVMDGTLLGKKGDDTGSNAEAPPPFAQATHVSAQQAAAVAAARGPPAAAAAASSAPAAAAPAAAASAVAPAPVSVAALTAQAGGVAAAAPAPAPAPAPSSSGSSGGGGASKAASSASGSSAWAKAFSFMKDTSNPVDGGKKNQLAVSSSTTTLKSTAKKKTSKSRAGQGRRAREELQPPQVRDGWRQVPRWLLRGAVVCTLSS